MPVLDLLPCGHDAVPERSPLDAKGVIYSWTRSRIGADELVLVMVDFFDGELRVTGPLLQDADVEIGQHVRIVEGRDTPYAFVLAS